MGKIFVLSVTDHEEYILSRIMEIIAADLFLKCAVEFFPVAFWLFFRIHGVPSHVYCIQYTTTIL